MPEAAAGLRKRIRRGHRQRTTPWRAFAAELPWLVFEDRAILELAAELRGRVASDGGDATAALLGAYRGALVSLAATPVDRGRVTPAAEGAPGDPFVAFDPVHCRGEQMN